MRTTPTHSSAGRSIALLGLALAAVGAALAIAFSLPLPVEEHTADVQSFVEGVQATREELLPRVAAAYEQGRIDALAAAHCEARK